MSCHKTYVPYKGTALPGNAEAVTLFNSVVAFGLDAAPHYHIVSKATNAEQFTSDMFEKHKHYLNPKVVSQSQVKRLIEKMIRTLYGGTVENKENA